MKKERKERIFLRKERERRKLTQKQVSEYLNIHKSTYCNIEKGTRNPGFSLAIRIADFFGIDERKLID